MNAKLLAAVVAGAIVGAAAAHGVPKAKHGGWVDTGAETSFELARTRHEVLVYIEDHGKPVSTEGGRGEILVGSETGRLIARLVPAGGNVLKGPVIAPARGAHLFVRVTFGNGSTEVGEIVVP